MVMLCLIGQKLTRKTVSAQNSRLTSEKKKVSRKETARNRQEDEWISAWLFRGALDLAVDAKNYGLDC